jgi:hypothetical protein
MKTKNIKLCYHALKNLVELTVNLFIRDTTVPIKDDPRKGWDADRFLTGQVDMLVIGQYNDPAAYARIGRLVELQVHNLPEMKALATLAVLRGERLQPLTTSRRRRIKELMNKAEGAIKILPKGTCKLRLWSLFSYHCGVYYDAIEDFLQAGYCQTESARIARSFGDRSGEAIGLFLGQVYLLKNSLVEAESAKYRQRIFKRLVARYGRLAIAARNTPMDVQWRLGNGPCHLIQACIWLNQSHRDLGKWVGLVKSAGKKMPGVWQKIAEYYQTVYAFMMGDETAKAELKQVAETGEINQRAEALLLLAREEMAQGNVSSARELAKKIPKHGVSIVRPIVLSLLEQAK